ncbi:MAG TPA: PilZ domain-containing protein [Candidatus Methylomirabilis sp.]|nr:PilZ domain-containing protein [Candidatus Methylomirabilis sp.]
MKPAGTGKRRHARLTFKEPVAEQVTATHDVLILDVSLGGSRVEHTTILRPGGTCYLRLPLGRQAVTVLCHIVWSRAIGRAEGEQRGTGLLFQSGLQFAALTPEVQKLLTAFLEAQGVPAGDQQTSH